MIKVSTKGRYGLRVMIELALHNGTKPVLLKNMARSQAISGKYLHQLLTTLRASGLVRSVRGAGGGYLLAKPPGTITAAEVVQALEGAFFPVECLQGEGYCSRACGCVAREVWQALAEAMERTLTSYTLDQLAARQKEKHFDQLTFHI